MAITVNLRYLGMCNPIKRTIFLIPFKAKAWLDLSDRKAAGESVEKQRILL